MGNKERVRLARYESSSLDRFVTKFEIDPITGCWNWVAGLSDDGYGQFTYDGKTITAHRWAWQHFVSDIPKGMHLCHVCDNRRCVNFDHLFIGTNLDNMRDKAAKGRSTKGENSHLSKLKEQDVLAIRALHKEGYILHALAKIYNIQHSTIGYIVNRVTWKHI